METKRPIADAPRDGRALTVFLPRQIGLAPQPHAHGYWDGEKGAWCFVETGRPIKPPPTEWREPTLDEALRAVGQAAYNGLCLAAENGELAYDGGVEAVEVRETDVSYVVCVPYGGRRLRVTVMEVGA